MKILRLSTMLIALSASALPGAAGAQPPNPPAPPGPPEPPPLPPAPPRARPPSAQPPASAPQARHSSAEVMQLTQQATTQLEAARAALAKGDKTAANRALTQSGEALSQLYNKPELSEVLSQIDAAIASIEGAGEGSKQALERLDLAPLSAAVQHYQVYLDPAVAAGIQEAAARAKQGNAKATTEALRLARDRVAFEVSLLPVEDAYVRVLAAQQALDRGDLKEAQRFLQNVPIVVAVMEVAAPLVPVRFKLNAAALAAQQGNWDRSRQLLREATSELERIEQRTKGSPAAQSVSALASDAEQLNRQMSSQARPRPEQIRDLARRTRDLGA